MRKTICCIVLIVITLISSSFSTVFAETSILISDITPSDGTKIELDTSGFITLSANVENANKVIFLVDGNIIEKFDVSSDGYTYDISMNGLEVGVHQFEIVGIDAMGRTKEKSVAFSTFVYMPSPVNAGISTEMQTFDVMSDAYAERTKDTELLSQFSSDFGWTLSGADTYLQRVAGKSGKAGDYAVRVISYGAAGNTNAMFSLDGWTQAVTSGTIVLDFDFQLNPVGSNTALKLRGIPFNAADNILSYTNKIYGSDFVVADNQWINMHYEYNVDNNTCSLKVDGQELWKNQAGGTKDANQNLSQLIFNPRYSSGANYFTSNYYARFTLDNFRIYMKSNVFEVTETGYQDSIGTHTSSFKIPFNSESVYVSVSTPITEIHDEDILLYVNGVEKPHRGLTVDNGKLSIALPIGIEEGSDIAVKSVNGFPVDISGRFVLGNALVSEMVVKKNDVLVDSSAMNVQEDDVVTVQCSASNNSSDSRQIILIAVASENDRTVYIKTKTAVLDANETDNLELSFTASKNHNNMTIRTFAIEEYATK